MSKVIANLDAALEAYRAQQGEVERVLRLFGRDWTLLADISTATLNPILQVQAMAEDATTQEQQNSVGVKALLAVQETIVGTVIPEERAELRKQLTEVGFPLGALETIMEQIMEVFTAAPLSEQEPTPTPTLAPAPESTIDSGSLSTQGGPTSSSVSTPPPPMPPTAAVPPNGHLESREPEPLMATASDSQLEQVAAQ